MTIPGTAEVYTPDPSASSSQSSTTTKKDSTEITKSMFMQLLVAQLKNQDPLNPADGTEFVTQLAQMQQLEASVNLTQDVSAIRTSIDKWSTATPSS